MKTLDPDLNSPSTGEVYQFVRSVEHSNKEIDRELALRVGLEVLRTRREFRRLVAYYCDIARKVAHENGLGFIVALEKLHCLIIKDKSRTGDIAVPVDSAIASETCATKRAD